MTSVLLVDDDLQIVRAIAPALAVSGLEVTVSSTGQEAINHLDSSRWDAMIVDLGLPDMDGKSVIRHLRTRFAIPVVVISAQHSAAEVEAAHLAGADLFMHKPFRTPELIRQVRELVGAA